jgi:transposase
MKSSKKASAAGRRERRKFTAEFKAEAVRLLTERRAVGGSLAQVARELDVGADQLRAWERELRPAGAERPGETPEQELKRLRREVDVLRQEQAFAKKVAAYFARESR